ncbi:hypothetical protein EZ456_09950 [Pedobacter psychrodurus]|uniref:Uncharacterized protein n=1 Tax=Pedobacter psychrodurus TaxID=2530456 RepID=A0A4R0PXI2_9SPHI|nr:hypothetical protein [Pedobacter psychrodurus]TCD27504.1 hypothetical protein EZ456_09950 [Pedobacter psychrodurus]
MKITEDQAAVIQILTDVLIKIALAGSSIGGFWYILVHIINGNATTFTWALAFLETMLSGTIYYIIAHYFPAFKAAVKKKPAARPRA